MSGVWFSTTTLYSLYNSSSNKSKALFQPLHVSVYTIMTWCPKDWLAYIHTHTYRLFFLIKHYKLTSNPWLEPVQALCMLPLGPLSLADSHGYISCTPQAGPMPGVNKFSGTFESFGFDFFVCFSYWPFTFSAWFSVSVVFFVCVSCLFSFVFISCWEKEREWEHYVGWVGRNVLEGVRRGKNIIKIYCGHFFLENYDQKPSTYSVFHFYSFSYLWRYSIMVYDKEILNLRSLLH